MSTSLMISRARDDTIKSVAACPWSGHLNCSIAVGTPSVRMLLSIKGLS